ncbi:hypothetical protein [Alkalilimnicola ehrlichii]|uniref:Uncharacterized protein n=1 Tax=Alkalilimnicola ehrlichii TaxID=351052 RepID=A0A3E0WU19_9GAMM|nr:hypothetical protein [Alkalilimnicola ehrlichii]RFA36470.1 hypothetical protein CAL65_10855 [Alkalilimnicola ehrlichii]
MKPLYRRFIVFDRVRQLVHIPHRFGDGVDRVRFQDASFCITDYPSGYANLRSATALYVVRPGWDLLRDGYPAQTRMVVVAGAGYEGHDKKTERAWRHIVQFMSRPAGSDEYSFQYMANETHGGDVIAYLRDLDPDSNYRRFEPKELGTLPNWIREPDGRWRRVGEAEARALMAAGGGAHADATS